MIDLSEIKHIHFVGIKGVGICSLALCAQDMGIKVTGSDIPELFITDKVLKERGIDYQTSFSIQNLTPVPDLVITTGAHGGLKNPEVVAAKELGIPVLTHGEALGLFAKGKKMIAVCGVGGKTTTSAMIAFILEKAGLKPSFAIGVSEIFGLGYGGKYEKDGEYFVCEADEYVSSPGTDNTPKFHLLNPDIIVATNIENDHPDIYPTLKDTLSAYRTFFEKLPEDGVLIISASDKNSQNLAKDMRQTVVTYAKAEISLKVPGEFNRRNAAAALAACREVGVEFSKAEDAMSSFTGTKRRFEKIGETASGALIIDDYAHHPSEIENLIKATREFYPGKKITIAFQPHTYSRTKALFVDFAKALSLADKVCVIDIYASRREEKDETVSSEILAEAVKKLNKNTFYIGDLKESARWLEEHIGKDEVLLTVGAGDIFYLHKELCKN